MLTRSGENSFSEELSAITSSSTKRSRAGFEYTLPMFEEICNEQADGGRELKRKSEETWVRVRSGKGFRMETRIKVYDEREGQYGFEEADKEETVHEQVLDNGLFTSSDAMKKQVEDVAMERHGAMDSAKALCAQDMSPPP